MKVAKRLTIYFMFLCILSILGIVFCRSSISTIVASFYFERGYFLFFQGNKTFIENLLMGISTTAGFTSISFLITYYSKKSAVQKELEYFYETVHHRCYERIFYKKNDYDNDYDEVSSMIRFLNRYTNTILDYVSKKPRTVILIKKLFIKKKRKKTLDVYKPFCDDSLQIFSYVGEDKYALICGIFGDLLSYFSFISGCHAFISEQQRIIEACKKKIERLPNINIDTYADDINIQDLKKYIDSPERGLYESHIRFAERTIDVTKNRLRTRFPLNSKEHKTFVDKKNLLAKFIAVDMQSIGNLYVLHTGDIFFPDFFCVDDQQDLYSVYDDSIKYIIV